MNINKIVNKLNENCLYKNDDVFQTIEWDESEFENGLNEIPSREYCSVKYGRRDKDDYVLCDNCADILNPYIVARKVRVSSTADLIKKMMEQMEKIKRDIQKIKDHLQI